MTGMSSSNHGEVVGFGAGAEIVCLVLNLRNALSRLTLTNYTRPEEIRLKFHFQEC